MIMRNIEVQGGPNPHTSAILVYLPSKHSLYLMNHRVYGYTYVHGEGGKRGDKGACVGAEDEIHVLEMERSNNLTLADKLKPIRATVLLEEEFFAVGELSCLASFTFRRIRAVEVGDVLVAYVAEPNCTHYLVLR